MNAHEDAWPYEWPCVDHGWSRHVCEPDCVLWDGYHIFPPVDNSRRSHAIQTKM